MNQLLDKQEKTCILTRRVTRLTDNKEVQIYPMGAERYLSKVLAGKESCRQNLIELIEGKDVLVIPGYGNASFLFAASGANSVTVYDKDPVTIAWVKAFKLYYHYRQQGFPSVGELLTALTAWYPPFLSLPTGNVRNSVLRVLRPNDLRRVYLHYLLDLVIEAVKTTPKESFALEKNLHFYSGTLDTLSQAKKKQHFDTAFVPYLLGVRNGIEQAEDIVIFVKQLLALLPEGQVLVTPTRHTKQYYWRGKRYFSTTPYQTLQDIPGLAEYSMEGEKNWFKTQGLVKISA